MPRAKKNTHLYELAKRGAAEQLRELLQEARLLVDTFPHLRDSVDKDELPISFIIARSSGQLTEKKSGRRRRMSAAARKAVSERMKKYWAARRKG